MNGLLGLFVVFEGIDGTGKGTQMDRAVKLLESVVDSVVRTKEPGGTQLGGLIREVMFEKYSTQQMAPGVVDLLFLASHLQNWQTVVKPALEEGRVVVCDRWWYSQEAYMTRRYVPDPVAHAYTHGHGERADILIYLHGDPEKTLSRAQGRETETHQKAKSWNNVEDQRQIQETYFKLFSGYSEWRPVCIDDKDIDQVWREVADIIWDSLSMPKERRTYDC